jgi:nitroreductase
MEMEFLELAKKRYSVRSFSDKKVEKEKIDLILEAGRVAPTAVNYQPQRILVIDSEEDLAKLDLCTRYRFNQTLAILVCYDKNISWKRKYDNEDMGDIDASIVATHMMLQAENIGIGSTWVGNFDPEAVIQNFNIPENIVPVAILMMGYPSEDATPAHLHYKRLNLAETTFYGSFPNVES